MYQIRQRLRTALTNPGPLMSFTAAALLALLAQVSRLPLHPATIIPFITYIPFIALSASFGGLGPGLLTTGLSLVEVVWFALRPLHSLKIADVQEALGLVAFGLSGIAISYLFERSKQAARSEELSQELAALLDNTFDAAFVWQFGAPGITWWNRAAERLYLYSRSEAIGKTKHELLRTVFPQGRADMETALRNYGVWEGELVHENQSGIRIDLESHMTTWKGRDGQLRVLEVNRDITERKRTQEELRKELEFRKLAFDSAGLGAWDYLLSTGEVFLDQRGCEMFGVAGGSHGVSYQEFMARIHPDDRTATNEAVERALSGVGEGVYRREFRVCIPEGAVRWVEGHGRVLFDGESATGQPVRFIGVNNDITERKRTDAALNEALDELQAMYSSAPVTLMVVDEQLHVRIVSDRSNQDDSIGNACARELLPGEVIRCVNALAQGCGRGPTCHACTISCTVLDCLKTGVKHDSREVWVRVMEDGIEQEKCLLVSVTPLQGASPRALLCAQDVTALKGAEGELRKQREILLRQIDLVNLSHDAIITSVNGRRVVAWNTGAEEMYGWTAAEAMGQSVPTLLKTRGNLTTAEIDVLLSQNGRCEAELMQIRRDGKTTTVESRQVLVRDQNGAPEAILEINRDVTERNRAMDELREANRRTAVILDSMPDGFSTFDHEWRYTYVNPAAAKLTGKTAGEMVGRTQWELFPRVPGSPFETVFRRAVQENMPFHVEVFYPEPVNKWLEVRCFPLPEGLAVFSNDVTERRRAAEEIQRLNTELEQRVKERTAQLEASNKELEAFAYSISHDLRAPLRGIDGWSLALLEDHGERLDEQAHLYLSRVRSETQRMGQLIDDLLHLSRLTRTEMKSEPVDLTKLALAVVGKLQESNPHRRVDFKIHLDLKAIGDPGLLEVALTNLLENALKFTATREYARVEFGQTEEESGRTFFVRDNGVGFDMVYSDMLFGAFQRLHKASEFPGTGIGLATVQRIIRRHGGRIWADARPNEGATFFFVIAQ